MKTVRAIDVLDYYDGVEIFKARDERGENYLGLRIDTSGDHDRYAVVGVRPERLREFCSGKLDLRELMLETPKGEWYVTVASMAFGQPMPLKLQDTPLEQADVLPSPGFTLDADLHNDRSIGECRSSDDESGVEASGIAPAQLP